MFHRDCFGGPDERRGESADYEPVEGLERRSVFGLGCSDSAGLFGAEAPAGRYMRTRNCETLQTTALVHEAYVRLVDLSSVRWQDRAHFFAVSAQIMRGILVDAARARRSQKRGGVLLRADSPIRVDLDQIPDMGSGRAEEILAIHEAMERLAKMDARQAQVVEMRFFGGLTVEEVAEVLKMSPQSVMRDWKLAKAWLRRELSREE